MPAADEQHLIRGAQEGDQMSFRVLIERYAKQAYNIAFSFVRNHQDAEDIAQEACIRAFRSLPSFRGDAQFSTWLYRIVVNLSLNAMKSGRRRQQHELSIANVDGGGSDHHHDSLDVMEHFERALHALPTLQRAVVILRHVDGLSTRQVSTILKCSEGTVKTHLFRGLRKMRERLSFLREDLR